MKNAMKTAIATNREFMLADTAGQKLFVMLKLRPTKDIATNLPPTSFTFVIDTSGSMYEVVAGDVEDTGVTYQQDGKEYKQVTGGKSKIDIVIESLLTLVNSGKLKQQDRVSIVQFDDSASQIIGLTSATETKQIETAIKKLRDFSGGTRMGLGLRRAFDILSEQEMTVKRTLLFTDGQTFDEDQCQSIANHFATRNIPITALGVGEEFNEDLLTYLSDYTGGKLFYVVPGIAKGTEVSMLDLPNKIISEYSEAQQEVITNLALTVKTVKGVELSRIVRAYPTQAEFPINQDPFPLGNAIAHDETIFILEFTVNNRPASRVRIAQLGLTYDIPGEKRRGEIPPENLIIQFLAGEHNAAQFNQEVMDYVQQCNIANLVDQSIKMAEKNPEKAEKLLETAKIMTLKLGNREMTESLNNAQSELRKTQKISSGTRKTVKMGAKGKTVKMGNDIDDILSEEEMRNIVGT